MPVNKHALQRYRIIDKLLADPYQDYTTQEITELINRECQKVSLRMVQKDLEALELEFQKELIRGEGGKGTVRYKDQSQPLFTQKLTSDEEEIFREVFKSLGQFEGLDNFTWFDSLKRRLNIKDDYSPVPIISFSRNELEMEDNLLGVLFTAISRRKTIRLTYEPFGEEPKQRIVYPYQLKQYNNRWFLLCTPIGDEEFAYDPDLILNFALDRIKGSVKYMEDIPYIQTTVDFYDRFNEVIGVTVLKEEKIISIYFAVKPSSLEYVRTKKLHETQIELYEEFQEEYRRKYPALSDCVFFSIECRKNYELLSLFASFMGSLVIVEPNELRDEFLAKMNAAIESYNQSI